MTEVALVIDGVDVVVNEGVTLLDACRSIAKQQPTLCYLETLAPVNVCRVCVVEVEGSRTLVPSCSRKVEGGMVVQTDSERVRHSRRVVFEMLASSVNLALVDHPTRAWMKSYPVTVALARNPKTPVAISMNLLPRLMDRDLRVLRFLLRVEKAALADRHDRHVRLP